MCNLALASYDTPTSVQKHTIPIGVQTSGLLLWRAPTCVQHGVTPLRLCPSLSVVSSRVLRLGAVPATVRAGLLDRDLMACGLWLSGCGKSVGFLVPVIVQLLRRGVSPPPVAPRVRGVALPLALILAPTRDHAEQIFDVARTLCDRTGIAPAVVYGGPGVKMSDQLRALDRGADVLVATPDHLVDLAQRGHVSLKCIR
jgi:hypothetical protein